MDNKKHFNISYWYYGGQAGNCWLILAKANPNPVGNGLKP